MNKSQTEWPRFSLATLILLFSLSAITMSHIVASVSHSRYRKIAETELNQLRDELGYLVIGNPEHLHLVNVVAVEPILRWRVQVPDQKKYELVVVVDGKTVTGPPQVFIPAGKSMLSVSLTYSRERWHLNTSIDRENQLSRKRWYCILQWLDLDGNCSVYTGHMAGGCKDLSVQRTESYGGDILLCDWFKNERDGIEISRTIEVYLRNR